MARENAIEEVRSIDTISGELTDGDSRERIDIDCPSCNHRFTFDRWARPALGKRAEPSCPTCDESFSVRVDGEFALVERDGWAVSVSIGREEPRR